MLIIQAVQLDSHLDLTHVRTQESLNMTLRRTVCGKFRKHIKQTLAAFTVKTSSGM